MGKEISNILKEATQGILTEETLKQIESAFNQAVNERVKIHVEKALNEQDSEYSEKLEKLLETIDIDRTAKLKRIVEAVDANNAQKLKLVVKKYQQVISEQASQFKDDLVDKISHYLDLFLESKVPQKTIEEAVKNNKARIILNNLRESLAIDTALLSDSLKDALLDGKTQIEEAKSAEKKARTELQTLKEEFERTEATLLIESKTAKLSPKKREYALKVLEGKSPKFIRENLDYTLSLFDKKEEERLALLKEQAFEKRKVKSDRPVTDDSASNVFGPEDEQTELVSESSEEKFGHVNNYLSELSKY
jgi:hypothetical protein